MRKAFLLALVVISSLSGLQAEYITEAVGDSLYIINNRTGEIHSFVRNGEILPITESSGRKDIEKTLSSEISIYGIEVDVKAKFTESKIYMTLTVDTGEDANEGVLEDLKRYSSAIVVEYYDSDNFLLGEDRIELKDAVSIVNDKDEIVSLRKSVILDGDHDLLRLVDEIDYTYSISDSVIPSKSYFKDNLEIGGIIGHFYAKDSFINMFLNEDFDILIDGVSLDDQIAESRTEAFRSGLYPDDVYSIEYGEFDSYYRVEYGEHLFEIRKSEDPAAINDYFVSFDDAEPVIYKGDRAFSFIPKFPVWLLGTWEAPEVDGIIKFLSDDLRLDEDYFGADLYDYWTNKYYETGVYEEMYSQETTENTYTLTILDDELDEGFMMFTKTDDPDIVTMTSSEGECYQLVRVQQ